MAGTEGGDRAGGCRALGATTRTVSLPQVRWSQSRVLSCRRCPLDPSGFLWGDQGGCEEAPGTVQEGAEGRQGPVWLEGQGPGSAWQVGPTAFPEGGRGCETGGAPGGLQDPGAGTESGRTGGEIRSEASGGVSVRSLRHPHGAVGGVEATRVWSRGESARLQTERGALGYGRCLGSLWGDLVGSGMTRQAGKETQGAGKDGRHKQRVNGGICCRDGGSPPAGLRP